MPSSWNKGFTKDTHPSIRKISESMINKKIDNFYNWRKEMQRKGRFPTPDSYLEYSPNLAEYIGVVLGDGNISTFPRTERIIISCDSNKPGFVDRYAIITERLFMKKPTVSKIKGVNGIRISLYQKEISRRLGIPTGNRSGSNFKIPSWILNDRINLIKFLRGLYEAEGSFCVHKPTSTYKLLFYNKNKSLRTAVFDSLLLLGFHPHQSGYQVQLSRKIEVFACKNLIEFRKYSKIY